jgi:hypothetical protein
MNSKHDGISSQPARKAFPAGRVVPALPLTMTKQKLAKAKPRNHTTGAAKGAKKDTEDGTQELCESKVARSYQSVANPSNGVSAHAGGVYGKSYEARENELESSNNYVKGSETASRDGISAITERLADTSQKIPEESEARIPKNELPPAFVAHEHPPYSSTSSQMPPSLSSLQISHPEIVRGGLEDASIPSPALTYSAGNPSFVPSVPSIPFQGHAHHFSESQIGPAPLGYQSPPVSWTQRSGFNPPPASNGYNIHNHTRQFPRDSVQTNGLHSQSFQRSRTESQTSGFDPRSPSVFDPHHEGSNHMLHEGNSFIPPLRAQQIPQVQPMQFASAALQNGLQYDHGDPLRDYLLNQFQDAHSSDCILEVESTGGGSLKIEAHKLLLARSPILRKLIQGRYEQSGRFSLNIDFPGKHFNGRSFADGIRHLYGGPLPTLDSLHGSAPRDKMAAALQFLAVGSFLSVDAISIRSMQLVFGLLRWDTVPTALAFALEGGLGPTWHKQPRFPNGRPDDDVSRAYHNSPMYEPYSTDLLFRLIDFVVHTIPQNFYIDPAAPELPEAPRLPSFVEASHGRHHSRHNPRLSQIRFGSITSEELQRPSPEATMISSILISLPFPILQNILEHIGLVHRLGSETAASVTRQVRKLPKNVVGCVH